MKVTFNLVLDTRRALKDGTFPLRFRITHERKSTYFQTIYTFTEKQYEKIKQGNRLNEEEKTINIKLFALHKKAASIIKEMESFDLDLFKMLFTGKGDRADLIFLLNEMVDINKKNSKFSTASSYSRAVSFICAFTGKESLKIKDVTVDFLERITFWALNTGYITNTGKSFLYSTTTVRIYLSLIQTILNQCLRNGEITRQSYPFGTKRENKFQMPPSQSNKRALSLEDIMKLYDYTPILYTEKRARGFFLFSYLSSGMNLVDIFQLKWSDFDGKKSFRFIRSKTKGRTSSPAYITVILNNDLWKIINELGSRKLNNNYVFDILSPSLTPEKINAKRITATSTINFYLKQIAKKIGITETISTYYARHSYATIMRNNNMPLGYISQQLGHADLKTTQNYLDSFPSEQAAEYDTHLLDKRIS